MQNQLTEQIQTTGKYTHTQLHTVTCQNYFINLNSLLFERCDFTIWMCRHVHVNLIIRLLLGKIHSVLIMLISSSLFHSVGSVIMFTMNM